MAKVSAGLLMYRLKNQKAEIFLVHPGGPYFKNKDGGYWGIPKGEVENNENLFAAACREFEEETGIKPPKESEKFISLESIKQKSGKIVHAWAFERDWGGLLMKQNFIEIESPYKSRKKIKIPEIDKAEFFPIGKARIKMNPEQFEFVNRLKNKLK